MWILALLVWASITAANFLYEALRHKNWGEAAKISYFQGMAIALFAWMASK